MVSKAYRIRRKRRDMSYNWYKRINPTVWIFAAAVALIVIGLSSPDLRVLLAIGGFIVSLYVIIWAVWILFGIVEQ